MRNISDEISQSPRFLYAILIRKNKLNFFGSKSTDPIQFTSIPLTLKQVELEWENLFGMRGYKIGPMFLSMDWPNRTMNLGSHLNLNSEYDHYIELLYAGELYLKIISP